MDVNIAGQKHGKYIYAFEGKSTDYNTIADLTAYKIDNFI